MYLRKCIIPALLAIALSLGLAGCGGGGGRLPGADVALLAAITTALGQITQVTVTATDAGDTIDVTGATAEIQRADGTTEDVPLAINAANRIVTLGTATVTPSTAQFNTLEITGPISFRDGATSTTTVIGRLIFQFEVLADGTVVRPTTISVRIPTRGAATDRRVIFGGLSGAAPDYVKTVIRDQQGGLTQSKIYAAQANGSVTVTDAQGSITAEVLSGPSSRITAMFARTDADPNGKPDLME
jgi:hypothetical protein